ncbi:MAG: ABC transporter ATP-binding protein [Magnetococcus sp. DMHC-6]
MKSTPYAVSIQELSHLYPGKRGKPPRTALHKLTLQIQSGDFFVLTGPNGSGKSTLFRILCGLVKPSSGTIDIDNHDLFKHPEIARQRMGVVFQKPALDKHLTVLENLRIHADLYGLPLPLFQQRLEESLLWSDLKTRLHDRVETLSGGMARQTELVKVLLHWPKILLLDEPTTGLDPVGRRAFLETIQRLQKERAVTILMTSHLLTEAEQADQVAILRQGSLLAMASPGELKASLGREILLIRAQHLDQLEQDLLPYPGLIVHRQNNELRVQGEDLWPLMEKMLVQNRERFYSLAIKQPDLEDLYIHLTGQALQAEEEKLENGS